MLKNIAKIIGGDPSKQAVDAYSDTVEKINKLEPEYEALSDEALKAKTAEFRQRLSAGETLDDLLPEAFAAVREASKRTIGLRPYDVQLMGGITLHKGRIAEMRTGEGKTLVATLPLYLNALESKGVHLVTVNDYLARRDARWMDPIYDLLGVSVGVLQMGSRTDGGRFGYLVDLKKEANHEDQHQLVQVERAEAYAADITYGTNNEFGFDYLRDNMRMTQAERVQRGHNFAIIDEVDNVLIDEARTPLIISGPAHDEAEHYVKMAQIVKRLNPEDYEVNEKDRTVTLTEMGNAHLEQLMGEPLSDPERPEDVSPEQARTMGFVEQAMRAQYLFKRNKDYLVQGGQVVIIDEFTGRLMPGRRWSDGLHQAVEAKEGVKVESENVTYATITIQNYFRMYEKLAGMTGTALTEAEEFDKIYKLDVVALPANVEYNASRKDSTLEEVEGKDEQGYRFNYFARRQDAEKLPVLWRRKDYPDMVYRTEEAKLRSIVLEIITIHVLGRPILVGTTSVERSDLLSNRLRPEPVQRLLQTLLLRQMWLEKNNKSDEGFLIPELQYLYEPLDKLNVTQMRQMGRDLGLQLNLQNEENLPRLLSALGLQPEHGERLVAVIQGGVPHQVLNARKHTEESQIIAGAGAFGAVTIATNMAGRGVDIKLGGEIAEEVTTAVNRVLRKAGHEQPYNMTYEQQRDALLKIAPEDYGIYKAEVDYFLQSVEEMGKVKTLGGLHVIGSERHEARRIDNQLRGRSARQGDPGSSRFYLSLQDDLMRLFGGEQVENAMKRMRMDDAVPLEYGLVSRIIEQSQTRVEGANFDARKHLLEYDDVLNSQRATVYTQRDRIMTKDDLTDDVLQMLEEEVGLRVPAALGDADGPWKLLAWLEQIQPTLVINRVLVPSFTFQLLLDELKEKKLSNPAEAKAALVDVAKKAIEAEEEHLLHSLEGLLESNHAKLESTLDERLETIETFKQGLRLEEEGQKRSSSELVNELSGLLHLPLKLDNNAQKMLREDPEAAADLIYEQVAVALREQTVTRVIGALERRLEIDLGLKAAELAKLEWDEIGAQLKNAVQAEFNARRERLIGNGDGQLAKEIGEIIGSEVNDASLLNALIAMPESRVTSFDKRSHQQVTQRRKRLSLAYYAASFVEKLSEDKIIEKVLAHLKNARTAIEGVWGMGAWEAVASRGKTELTPQANEALRNAVGQSFENLDGQPLNALPDEAKQLAIQELGRRSLNESYRQLLLRVISELWVDYLTRMEALRISVRLEAYAQRDPLVEYKAQAYRMFQDLFNDMRSSLVNRMFIFQPGTARQAAPQQPAANGGAAAQAAAAPAQSQDGESNGAGEAGKRKRKRHKK
jgi:preprotein translocase subunit SecA